MTPNGMGAFEWIAVGGTAMGVATTSDALAGTNVISLQGTSGHIPDGGLIKFSNDHRTYTVQTGVKDVSQPAQSIILASNLSSTIPAGSLVYTGGELCRGIKHSGYKKTSSILGIGLPTVWKRAWYETGEVVRIYIDYGYTRLDHSHKDIRQYKASPIGVSIGTMHSTSERYRITISGIEDIFAPNQANDYDAFESYLDAWAKGQPFIWYPDIENRPNEFLWCSLVSRPDSVRMNMLHYHEFTFTIAVEPTRLIL